MIRSVMPYVARFSVERAIVLLTLLFLTNSAPLAHAQSDVIGVTTCCPNDALTVNPASGATSLIGPIGDATSSFFPAAMAVDPINNFLYAVRAQSGSPPVVIRVDLTTGTVIQSAPLAGVLLQLGFDFSTGQLIGLTTCCPNQVVWVDFDTGAFDVIADIGGTGISFVVTPPPVWPGNAIFFVATNLALGTSVLVTVDLASGVVTESGQLTESIAFLGADPATGDLFAITECCPSEFATVDPNSGVVIGLEEVGDTTQSFGPVISPVDPVSRRFHALRTDGTDYRTLIIDVDSGAFVAGGVIPAEPLILAVVEDAGVSFIRGDTNTDGATDLADAVYALASLFIAGSEPPSCVDAADANDDGTFDVSDPVYQLAVLFIPGTDPYPPPSDCAADPTDDAATCDSFVACP